MYKSEFEPSSEALEVLRKGHILAEDESPTDMIERVVTTAFEAETVFGTSAKEIASLEQEFGRMCDSGEVVMSTPVMTNAGRYIDKPLTACSMPPVDLRGDLGNVKSIVDTLHQQGMGTGFNLGDVEDPVAMLAYLNRIAVQGADSGNEDRPVGNMAIIPVRHPNIQEFIDAKKYSSSDGSVWKFNISIDVDDNFMNAVAADDKIKLDDGTLVSAGEIFSQICEAAHQSADPGLIFLDRMNNRNPTPGIGFYKTTAPCAEVGLAPGETCQFGYINLGRFVVENAEGVSIDYDRLAKTATMLVRVLDNCLELSIHKYTTPQSERIMRLKRKIGVGVCGVADLLTKTGEPYSSDAAVNRVKDALAWINYQTKLGSIELANNRGSCEAMALTNTLDDVPMNRHTSERPLIESLFSNLDTKMVSGDQWGRLAQEIRDVRMLRNVTTTALPPTGRSSLVIDASTGIEPHFSLTNRSGMLRENIATYLCSQNISEARYFDIKSGRVSASESEQTALAACEVATGISASNHLNMAAGAQKAIDEAVSKTVNMHTDTTVHDVKEIYFKAWQDGMSGITIYREGTHSLQPVRLDEAK